MAPCGMQLGGKCLGQDRSRSLITSCCFDHVSPLFVCARARGPGRIRPESLWPKSPGKHLVQTAPRTLQRHLSLTVAALETGM